MSTLWPIRPRGPSRWKLNREKIDDNYGLQFLKWLKITFTYFFYQFLVLLNYSERDQESLPASPPDCLCQTGLTYWSVTPPMNRTIPNILLLCKVLFPGSLHPLGDRWQVTDDSWQVTGDKWQVAGESWQLTADSWQQTAERLQVTVKWFSVSRMPDFSM